MSLLKFPLNTKLKNLPVEHRVLLRLVSLQSRRKKLAELRPLAKETGTPFMQAMKAVELLAAGQYIKIVPHTANSFEFEVEAENFKQGLKLAAGYDRHLESQAARALKAPVQAPPPHLVPITVDQRAPWMEKARAISAELAAPALDFKVANCLARIGEEEVNRLLESARKRHAAASAVEGDKKPSLVRLFFTAYTARRNELLPATEAALALNQEIYEAMVQPRQYAKHEPGKPG